MRKRWLIAAMVTVLMLCLGYGLLGGIAIIGFQSPLPQDLWHAADGSLSAAAPRARGATLIAGLMLAGNPWVFAVLKDRPGAVKG